MSVIVEMCAQLIYHHFFVLSSINAKIDSKLFPFVSGTKINTNNAPEKQQAANMKRHPCSSKIPATIGKYCNEKMFTITF